MIAIFFSFFLIKTNQIIYSKKKLIELNLTKKSTTFSKLKQICNKMWKKIIDRKEKKNKCKEEKENVVCLRN